MFALQDLADTSADHRECQTPQEGSPSLQRGLISLTDSAFKFQWIVTNLVAVREAMQSMSFEKNMEGTLRAVYGHRPNWHGSCLIDRYGDIRKSHNEGDPKEFGVSCEMILSILDAEVSSFQRLLDLTLDRDAARECMRDATTLPSQEEIA